MDYISKAYQALTDPISRENFEKYGHPDGRQVIYASADLLDHFTQKTNLGTKTQNKC